jgi:hypothetical protein
LFGGSSERCGGFRDAALQPLDRVPARPHDDDVPHPVIRLPPGGVRQRAATESWNQTGLRQRRFAGAAVGGDGDQPVPSEFGDELSELFAATEESVGIAFGHRLEADEGIFKHDDLVERRPAQHGPEEFGELI